MDPMPILFYLQNVVNIKVFGSEGRAICKKRKKRKAKHLTFSLVKTALNAEEHHEYVLAVTNKCKILLLTLFKHFL